MKKKVRDLAEWILADGKNNPKLPPQWENTLVCKDGNHEEYYVSDGYMMLRIPESITERTFQLNKRPLDPCIDTRAIQLPSVSEMKEGIRSVAGRKYGTGVIWGEVTTSPFVFNARWLVKIQEALNSRLIYKDGKQAGYLVEDDNWNNDIYCMVLSIYGMPFNGFRVIK